VSAYFHIHVLLCGREKVKLWAQWGGRFSLENYSCVKNETPHCHGSGLRAISIRAGESPIAAANRDAAQVRSAALLKGMVSATLLFRLALVA